MALRPKMEPKDVRNLDKPKPRWSYKYQCGGKDRYFSEEGARRALRRYRDMFSRNDMATMIAYRCTFCKHWHCGHQAL